MDFERVSGILLPFPFVNEEYFCRRLEKFAVYVQVLNLFDFDIRVNSLKFVELILKLLILKLVLVFLRALRKNVYERTSEKSFKRLL